LRRSEQLVRHKPTQVVFDRTGEVEMVDQSQNGFDRRVVRIVIDGLEDLIADQAFAERSSRVLQ